MYLRTLDPVHFTIDFLSKCLHYDNQLIVSDHDNRLSYLSGGVSKIWVRKSSESGIKTDILKILQ